MAESETAEVTVGDEAADFETGVDGFTVVERGLADWPDDTVVVQADEPVTVRIGGIFQEADETGQPVAGTGEAVTHDFEYFIVSSLSDTIEGDEAQFASMVLGLEMDEDGVIEINEAGVFVTNEDYVDGPKIVEVQGGGLADAFAEFAEENGF